MTDIPTFKLSISARLGTSAWIEDDRLVLRVTPRPETEQLGCLRTSVVSYVVDAAAGIAVDTDPDRWTFTSDMTVHSSLIADAAWLDARATVLRRGGRSATCEVRVHDDRGRQVAYGVLGFANVARREGDLPKPTIDFAVAAADWGALPPIDAPLRGLAGIRTVDAAQGIVEVPITDELRNPAGAVQGAIVALIGEAAAEDLVASRAGRPAIVTSLEIRYLAQARVGPIRTRAELLGDGPDAPVLVELRDTSDARLLTTVVARATTDVPTA